MRVWIVALGIVLIAASGCCTPIGCGVGCHALIGCDDCEGGFGPPSIPHGPWDGWRQAKRSLVCGRGCGEVYYGEWISTPPHCSDPCCDDQFIGGAVHCTPFCWEPGSLLRNLYGRRFCECCQSWGDDCDCGDEAIAHTDFEMYSQSVDSAEGCPCGQSHDAVLSPVSKGTRFERAISHGRLVREIRTPEPLPSKGLSQTRPMAPKQVEAARRNPQPVKR